MSETKNNPVFQLMFSYTTLVSTSPRTPGQGWMSIWGDTRRLPSITKYKVKRFWFFSKIKNNFMSQIVRLLPETGNCRDTFQIGDGDSPQTVESFDECIQVCETVRCGREVFRVKTIFRVPCITLWWRRSQGAQFLGSQIEPIFV